MSLHTEPKIEAIHALIEKYIEARLLQINERNNSEKKSKTTSAFISTQDAKASSTDNDGLIIKLRQIKQAISLLNERVEADIKKNKENATFYAAHRENVLNLILNVNKKYEAKQLSASDFKPNPIKPNYKRRGQDFVPVVATWSASSTILFLAIGGVLVLVGSFILTMLLLMATPEVMMSPIGGMLLCGIIAVMLGSIIEPIAAGVGLLLGAAVGAANYFLSDIPKGSLGEFYQKEENPTFFNSGRNFFDYSTLHSVYRNLDSLGIEAIEVEEKPVNEVQQSSGMAA